MKNLSYHIDPYRLDHEKALLELERLSPQGKDVKFEMVRPEFLSRSKVFDNYFVFVALEDNSEKVIGVSAVSIVPVKIEGKMIDVGFGYDLKVHPAYRNMGIAKSFAQCLINNYLMKEGVSEYYTTFKSSNDSMNKVVNFIQRKWYNYTFYYLTIPTYKRIKQSSFQKRDQPLSIEMFGDSRKLKNLIVELDRDIKIWKTYSTYMLRIKENPWLFRVGTRLLNTFRENSKRIPEKGDLLKFATLYDFNYSNIDSVNDALEVLQKENIQFLNICCTQNDFIYTLFKPIAINIMPYSMLNTFGLTNKKKLSLDVRCL